MKQFAVADDLRGRVGIMSSMSEMSAAIAFAESIGHTAASARVTCADGGWSTVRVKMEDGPPVLFEVSKGIPNPD